MIDRDEANKRWPPREKFKRPENQRGLDATEFVARYGEIRARVDPLEQGGISDRLSNFDEWGNRVRDRG